MKCVCEVICRSALVLFKTMVFQKDTKWLLNISNTTIKKLWYMRYGVGKTSGI